MLTVFLILFMALLIFNFPIFVAFLISSFVALYFFFSNMPLEIVVQTCFRTVDKFDLVAVPYFILTAHIMSRGGMANRLIDWALALVGSIKGSLGMATILSAEFFGALSGSAPATVAALGRILYPALRENKYGEGYSLGLITAGGSIAILIPPSITMIIYASIADTSVAKLFIAGIIPGLMVGLFYAVYTLYYVFRNKVPTTGSFSLRRVFVSTKRAGWTLGVPVLILGGIYSGIFTPTESAAASSVYAIFVSAFIYKELSIRDLFNIGVDTADLTAKIFIIVAASGIFSWILTIGQAPQLVAAAVNNSNVPYFVLLIMVNIVLLIAGMFIHPTSITIIFTPLFLPLLMAMGIDPVHFGIILTLNIAIGMYSPPFGLNLFITSGVFNVPISKIIPGLVPFIIVSLIALLLVTYIPAISLFLPGLM
jgi:C4-dicarboxylate transporter DctM subunit